MPPRTIKGAGFSEDILAFLQLLAARRVRYLVVGGEAVIYHGYPRVTGDVDFFTKTQGRMPSGSSTPCAGRIPGVRSPGELREPGLVFQFGCPPHRIALMNRIDGVSFLEAWRSRITARLETASGPVPIRYIDRGPLLKNKRAAGRAKDLEDARFLGEKRRQQSQRKRI